MKKTLIIALGVLCSAWIPCVAIADDNQLLDFKKITLTASRNVKTRKIRKGVIPPEYGISNRDDDFAKDDKLDIVTIKVLVANKTGKDVEGLHVRCEFYGRDVSMRKKEVGPVGTEEIKVSFNAKGVFNCEFRKYMLYDRSQDTVSVGDRVGSGKTSVSLPAHGVSFFGYKITLLSKDGTVIKTLSWPSNISTLKLVSNILERELPTCLGSGGGTLEDCVSPSKNPPGEDGDANPSKTLHKGMKGLNGLM